MYNYMGDEVRMVDGGGGLEIIIVFKYVCAYIMLIPIC